MEIDIKGLKGKEVERILDLLEELKIKDTHMIVGIERAISLTFEKMNREFASKLDKVIEEIEKADLSQLGNFNFRVGIDTCKSIIKKHFPDEVKP